MLALGQQVLTKPVQDHKLATEHLGHIEALRHQHNLNNQSHVWHTHGDRAEECLHTQRTLVMHMPATGKLTIATVVYTIFTQFPVFSLTSGQSHDLQQMTQVAADTLQDRLAA